MSAGVNAVGSGESLRMIVPSASAIASA